MLLASLGAPAFVAAADVERREQGNLVIESIPPIPQRLVDRMRQYQNARWADLIDWDPDGRGLYVMTRFGETAQVHFVDHAGGARHQLTFFSEPVGGAAVCPDGKRRALLLTKDVGGNETYQVFAYERATGQTRMLTDGVARHGGVLWNHAGSAFAYYSTKRNGTDWDLYTSDLGGLPHEKRILAQGGQWVPVDWSPDGRQLLVKRLVSITESYVHILDIASGELRPINPTEEKIAYGEAVWAQNGQGIFITSDQDTEFRHLRYFDLASGKMTNLTPDIPWDIRSLEISPQGDRLAFVANENGMGQVYFMDTDTRPRKHTRVPGLPVGLIYGLKFSPDGKRLGLVTNTPRTPGDVQVYHLETHKRVRWTFSEVGGLDSSTFVVPELIEYPTFDRVDGKPRQIPAFLFRPTAPAKGGKVPVLILIHGGPESQARPYFSAIRQYFVGELGLAVLVPNVRGSAGYGKSYLKLDNGYQREDSVKDIGAAIDWIGTQPELDTERIGVFGGSYGGYMVLASMIHFADRLRCGIDVVGISNFVTFLENTKPYRRDLRRVEYGDERDPKMRAFLERISPTTHAARITDPLFIVQGQNDPRVPASESAQILSAMRKNQRDVWYLLARDEGHGFRKKSNRDFSIQASVLFLEKHLVGATD